MIERETGYRQISLEMTGMCVIHLHSAHMTAFGGKQRFTLILLFTVSIRFHFLCPLSCSAGVPSHLPCFAAPRSASALINLAFELWGDGELKRYAVDQPWQWVSCCSTLWTMRASGPSAFLQLLIQTLISTPQTLVQLVQCRPWLVRQTDQ